ncbi:MAG: hypothetical protein IPJ88_05180 [Myxococcales bacterium]|nr:MAG: hypothetical protein IPJ88_05180 [Myxococcales bacterium]
MSVDEQTLQQYYDGELPEAEMKRVEQVILNDSALQAKLESYDVLGAMLRTYADETAQAPSFGPVLRAIRSTQKPVAPSIRSRVLSWKEFILGSGMRLLFPAGALAMAVLLFIFIKQDTAGEQQPVASRLPKVQTPAFIAKAKDKAATALANAGRSEVVEVDFGNNTGTVMDIEDVDGEHIAVLWVDDPEEQSN